MINEIQTDSETRMKKSIEALQAELTKLRTGRAHPSLLDQVMVSYYGTDTALNQVANISVADPRTLLVTPWEKTLVAAIEKAIISSNLGLNPSSHGDAIHVPLPPLTEERRKEFIRLVKAEAEQARVAVRNIRRDANNQLKELNKSKDISEDEERRAQESIQKLTDKYTAEIDKITVAKEADLMEV